MGSWGEADSSPQEPCSTERLATVVLQGLTSMFENAISKLSPAEPALSLSNGDG
jgi:hypothetical protein